MALLARERDLSAILIPHINADKSLQVPSTK
jgi:hypothetical protein